MFTPMRGKTPVGVSLCNITITYDNFTPYLHLPTELHFVCGNKAYTWLPPDWSGKCYITFLLPPTFNRDNMYHRQRRQLPDVDQTDTTGQRFYDAMKGLLLYWGPMSNSLQIRRLTRVLETTINVTAEILTNYSAKLDATRMVALQNRMVLDVILADRGGACRNIGASCCVYFPHSSPSVDDAISKLHRITSEIHQETESSWTWSSGFWQLLVSWGWKMITILLTPLALLFFCCLCIQCGPHTVLSVLSDVHHLPRRLN
ncbi:syncytin-A-like [Lissotriton helveticus]